MLTVRQIVAATRGQLLCGKETVRLKGVSIDSRTIQPGEIFVAIKGNRLDGHRFIEAAVAKGASAIIISDKVKLSLPVAIIIAKDTTKALGDLAAYYRRLFDIPIIAITGSAGKTTTKEMIAAVLGKRYNVLKSQKSENNQYGVPLTILRLNSSHQVAVLELGTNQPGDIKRLTQIAKPTVAVYTNVGASHLQGLKSINGVFNEKFNLIRHMSLKGQVIFNNDDENLRKIKEKKISQRKLSYGMESDADCRTESVNLSKENEIKFYVKGKEFVIKNPAFHNVYNALAAVCCGFLFKLNYKDIFSGIANFHFPSGRQNFQKVDGCHIIDDTYNANPVSFFSAIHTLDSLNAPGRKIVVCADMLELGPYARRYHQELGRKIAQSSIDMVLTVGKHSKMISSLLKRDRNCNIQSLHCQNLVQVNRHLRRQCRKGDTVLIKGSRAMGMEKTVSYLKDYLTRHHS